MTRRLSSLYAFLTINACQQHWQTFEPSSSSCHHCAFHTNTNQFNVNCHRIKNNQHTEGLWSCSQPRQFPHGLKYVNLLHQDARSTLTISLSSFIQSDTKVSSNVCAEIQHNGIQYWRIQQIKFWNHHSWLSDSDASHQKTGSFKIKWHEVIWYALQLSLQWSEFHPATFFYSAGARDKWSQSPIKETKIKLYNTLYTRKPREIPTSHSENPN